MTYLYAGWHDTYKCIYDPAFQAAALLRKQNRTTEEARLREVQLELLIRDVAQEEADLHQEPIAAKPRKHKRKKPLKSTERPLRSGEQRITPAEKKSRTSIIQAQTDRSLVALTAAAARLDQPAIEQVGVQAAGGARGAGAAARGAVARGAVARGGVANARRARAEHDSPSASDGESGDTEKSTSDENAAGADSCAPSDDDDDDDDDSGDETPLVLEGEERNLTWLWDKVRDSLSGGMTTAKCKDAVQKFYDLLGSCIDEVAGAGDNKRKLDLLRGYERDARDCVSSLLSGQAGILLEGVHFSRVSNQALPAAASGGRRAPPPERFRDRQPNAD